jgi:creatinine amidohydrolase
LIPWRLHELALQDTQKKKYKVAVLPIGSTEAHGYHLPYGSDAFHSTAIAERVCSKAWQQGSRVLLLPTMPYGVQGNTMGFPLTMNIQQTALDSFVIDIVHSLEHHGVRKLLIINGHEGNDFAPLLRSLYGKTKVFVILADWWKVGKDRIKDIFEIAGEHADELETSVDLALVENLVHLENAGSGRVHSSRFEAINKGWISITRPWHLFTEDSTVGDSRKATKAKGETYIQLVVDRLTKYFTELEKSRMDARFPY